MLWLEMQKLVTSLTGFGKFLNKRILDLTFLAFWWLEPLESVVWVESLTFIAQINTSSFTPY